MGLSDYNPQVMVQNAYFGIHTYRLSAFFAHTAKELNCALATVIQQSLVICHRNHPSCKINSPLKTRAMKGYKLTLILTSLALRIQSSFCPVHFSIFPAPTLCLSAPLPSLSMHHRRAGVHVIKCDNKSKLYRRKVLSFV